MAGHLLSAIGFALPAAAVLLVASVGFTLQFGMTNIFNLGYGAIMTIAALAGSIVFQNGGGLLASAITAVVVGIVATVVIGLGLYRPFVRKGAKLFEMIMISLAVGLILEYAVGGYMHGNVEHFSLPTPIAVRSGYFLLTNLDLGEIAVAIAVVLLLVAFLKWTPIGIAIRATAVNAPLARVTGISTGRITNLTWIISGGLCGLSGILLTAESQSLTSAAATNYLPIILAAVIVGGVGSIGGTAIASVGLAILLQICGALGASAYETVIALGVLVAILLLRPKGVFGELWDKKEITV